MHLFIGKRTDFDLCKGIFYSYSGVSTIQILKNHSSNQSICISDVQLMHPKQLAILYKLSLAISAIYIDFRLYLHSTTLLPLRFMLLATTTKIQLEYQSLETCSLYEIQQWLQRNEYNRAIARGLITHEQSMQLRTINKL